MRNELSEWGDIMRMARRAASLAASCPETTEAKKRLTLLGDCPNAFVLYTDDPTTAGLLMCCPDMPAICNASEIVGVCIVMQENFPSDSFEAERPSLEHPRIAAPWVAPSKGFCPRCRSYSKQDQSAELCARCTNVIGDQT